jgi:hypothetical protein
LQPAGSNDENSLLNSNGKHVSCEPSALSHYSAALATHSLALASFHVTSGRGSSRGTRHPRQRP